MQKAFQVTLNHFVLRPFFRIGYLKRFKPLRLILSQKSGKFGFAFICKTTIAISDCAAHWRWILAVVVGKA